MMKFFVSWQLWEKLTFVLGAALVGVFLMGYVKLWWINRRVRKHEIGDEEKRVRREEIRKSGNIIESLVEEDPIPFGVRALEKGVETPGIWYSKDNTPVPEHLRIGRYVKRGSTTSVVTVPKTGSSKSSLSIPSIKEGGRRAMSAFVLSSPNIEFSPTSDTADGNAEPSSSRLTYQPRRSSQLRYSSYNEVKYDPDTLGQLEGNPSMKDDVKVHRPHGSRPTPSNNPSSISLADNERSSGSSSMTSDDSLANNSTNNASQNLKRATARLPSLSHENGEYFSRRPPRTPAEASQLDPFITPDHTPSASETSSRYNATPSIYHTAGESTVGESDMLIDANSREPSPDRRAVSFDAGIQLANRQTRHVNSGFSVFPAGTFNGRTAEPKGKEVTRPATANSQGSQASQNSQTSEPSSQAKKKHNKLQKKAKFSITGPRRSDDLR